MTRSWSICVCLAVCAAAVAAASRKPAPPSLSLPAAIATIHTPSRVSSLALAKTRPLAATVSRDLKIRILDLADGAEQRAIDIAGRDVDVFAFSANGQNVAIGDHKGVVTVWDAATGETRCEVRLPHYPGVGVFSHDGRRFATAAQGDPIRLIDIATGRAAVVLGSPVGGTNVLAFSRDDRWIATGDGDAVIRIYDAATGRRTAENHELQMIPLAIDFTADGGTVIAGSGDKSLLFVDTATAKTKERHNRTAQPVAYIEVSPDGTAFATAFMKSENMTEPDHVVVRSSDGRNVLVDWLPPALPAGGGWASDGRMLVAIASSDAIHLWRLR